MPGYLVIGVILILLVFFIFLAAGKNQLVKTTTVKIGNATIKAELADTETKQLRGLMFRKSLAKDSGMLFVFPKEGRHSIWMMNMSIPLDIIWLDKDKKVIKVEENVQPCEALLICKTYSPDSDDMYVLEVNSGYAKTHGIKTGMKAYFELN
jgi:uncharacterized membrane protein (UPF0127 family)